MEILSHDAPHNTNTLFRKIREVEINFSEMVFTDFLFRVIVLILLIGFIFCPYTIIVPISSIRLIPSIF